MILNERASQENLLRQWSQPLQEEAPSFSAWSFGKAGVKGLPMAGLEVAGSWADLLSGFATPYAATFAEDTAARKKMLTEGSFDFSAGNQLRAKADTYAPDPMTAHRADVVINGLTRTMGKAVGYLGTMGGIPGAVAFGADEGNTAAQRLMEKGVDPATAAKVGGVTAVVSAATAAAPVAGKTALQTLGIVAATGPVAYVTQEALAKRILQDYPHEAQTHDPTDPLGLALSIAVPAIAGGLHMRSVAKAEKAANGLKGEAGMKAEATLTEAEQAHSDAFERSEGNIKELRQAIEAEKTPEGKKVLQAELDKQLKEAQAHAGETLKREVTPEVVDAARVKVQEDRLQQGLPDAPYARSEVMRAADELGAGEQPRVAPVPDYALPRTLADAPEPAAAAEELRSMARGAFWAQEGGQLLRSGVDEAGDGGMGGSVVSRTKWIPADEWFGRMRSQLGRDGLSSQADIAVAVEKAIAGERLKAGEKRTIDWMRTEVDEMRMNAMRAGLDREFAHAVADEGFANGLGAPDAASLTLTARAAQIDETAVERAAIQFENDEAGFLAEMRRIAGDEQQANRAADLQGSGTRAGGLGGGQAPAGRNALEEVGNKAAGKAAPETTASPFDRSAVKALAEELPDKRVSLPGHEAMSLTEALETAKAEADEIRSFGELVRAAVQCALQNGITA